MGLESMLQDGCKVYQRDYEEYADREECWAAMAEQRQQAKTTAEGEFQK